MLITGMVHTSALGTSQALLIVIFSCPFCLQAWGDCVLQYFVDLVVGNTSTTDSLISAINPSPAGLCSVSPTACTYLDTNGYDPTSNSGGSGGCASRELATIEQIISCPAPASSPPPPPVADSPPPPEQLSPPPSLSPPPPAPAATNDSFYVQWVVTPESNGSCPAPNAAEIMAIIARMQNDFANFSSDIQSVAVTPVNTSTRVSVCLGVPVLQAALLYLSCTLGTCRVCHASLWFRGDNSLRPFGLWLHSIR